MLANAARARLTRSPAGVSYTALFVMVTADMAIEYGANTEMAAWAVRRPENATHAMSVSFLDSTGFVV